MSDATRKVEPGERVASHGMFGVFAPYESHDGPVGWTVQRYVEGSDDPDLMGHLLAEFAEREDAEAFAKVKAHGNAHDDLLAACKAWVDYFDALTRHDEPGDRLAEARKSVHGARVEATRAAIRKAQPQAVRP